jgi:putative transposase
LNRAYLYRLYPNKEQDFKLDGLLKIARELYNSCLAERKYAYKMQGVSLNFYDQCNELSELKKCIPELALLNAQAAQDLLHRLDKAFKNFFRRVKKGEKPGYPRFKGRNQFHSITFPTYGDGCKLKGGKLYVRNAGLLKIKMHRELDGQIKTVTIKRENDKWYAVFCCEVEPEPLPQSDNEVGIDVGIEYFAVTSDGEFIENPHYLRVSEDRLKRAQRKVSRRKKGSHNRRKAVKLLAKQHQKIRNQRKDFQHKVASEIVKQYGYIAVEKLKVKNMEQNHHLAKSINDVSWSQFFDMLAYKAEWAGRKFVKVNPNGTSQRCSVCGTVVKKSLGVRVHDCPNCGVILQRDYNSALEILALGRSVWGVTWNRSSCVPQEAVCFS